MPSLVGDGGVRAGQGCLGWSWGGTWGTVGCSLRCRSVPTYLPQTPFSLCPPLQPQLGFALSGRGMRENGNQNPEILAPLWGKRPLGDQEAAKRQGGGDCREWDSGVGVVTKGTKSSPDTWL